MANVLIVDDSKISRAMIREMLEGVGHRIVGEVADGEAMVRAYGELRPDLVTVDFEMPVLNGYDASEKVLSLDKDARIIMITSVMRKHEHLKVLKAGVAAVLSKPFEKEELIGMVDQILKK